MTTKHLDRTTFTTSRVLEFFSEKELQMQIGHARDVWPIALVKELIDNALDACEGSGIPPHIAVTVEPDAVHIQDNGPGLPVTTLERSLDYLVRVSDKAHYVSPSRGQLGNALKCVWAAPFVVSGQHGRVDVAAGGVCHQIDVHLDRIAQRPQIERAEVPSIVKTGTVITMHWPQIAGYLDSPQGNSFYKPPNLWSVLNSYAAFNPHATVTLETPSLWMWHHTAPEWSKWLPSAPTSPHWYTVERLRSLIAAYIAAEQDGDRPRTVREFVAEFAGLSGSAKPKAVIESAGLQGTYLRDLVAAGDVHLGQVDPLLAAMQDAARPIKPQALGILGEAHMAAHMAAHRFVQPESVRYKKIDGDASGLPFVLEVAFGVNRSEFQECGSDIAIGLNWSPALTRSPIRQLSQILGEQRVDSYDPVVLLVHLACPRLEFTDRGKSVLALPEPILSALDRAVRDVTKDWKRAKRNADREDRVHQRDLDDLRKKERQRELNFKEAVALVMEAAYMKASANNTLPANARQIMYPARPLVLQLTGGKCWKNSSYFTQHLLPDFIEEHPDLTSEWDVVFDARGHIAEPHTERSIDIGTLAVRRYLDTWSDSVDAKIDALPVDYAVDTSGPAHRYRYALFVEKEGFNELLRSTQIAERYDLAIMSTKGMSVTALRTLVEQLSEKGVTVLVLHDFDKAGFSISHTLRSDTRRYRFRRTPRVHDLGLRLADVHAMNLQSELVEYDGKIDPRINLQESGATEEECDYLVRSSRPPWHGQRVELNAMDSAQFITWLEQKLNDIGVCKVVPDADTLANAYQRAHVLAAVQQAIDTTLAAYQSSTIVVPENLTELVQTAINDTPLPWDHAIWTLVQEPKP